MTPLEIPPSNRRRRSDSWAYHLTDPKFIVAVTGLIVALNAKCDGVKTADRVDTHALKIQENSDTIKQNAEATNTVSEVVGLPPLASPGDSK